MVSAPVCISALSLLIYPARPAQILDDGLGKRRLPFICTLLDPVNAILHVELVGRHQFLKDRLVALAKLFERDLCELIRILGDMECVGYLRQSRITQVSSVFHSAADLL